MQLEINLIFIDEDEKGIYNVYTLGGKQDVLLLYSNRIYYWLI